MGAITEELKNLEKLLGAIESSNLKLPSSQLYTSWKIFGLPQKIWARAAHCASVSAVK